MSLSALEKLQERAKEARDEASIALKTAQSQLEDLQGKVREIQEQLALPHPVMMSSAALQLYSARRQALQNLSAKSVAALAQAKAEIGLRQSALTHAAVNEAKYKKLISRKVELAESKKAKSEQRALDDMAAQMWIRNRRGFD